MLGLINWRLKVTINDGRAFIGQMLAFDRHMNLVLADCEEFRHVRPKKKPGETEPAPEQEMKRSLGLVILRGETVVSLSVEGPPPVQDDEKKNAVRGDPSPPLFPYFWNATSHYFPFLMHPSSHLAQVVACQLDAGWEWCLPVRLVFCPKYFRSGMIVTHCGTFSYRQRVPQRLRDPRCRLRNLVCQVRLLASVRLDSHQECHSPLLGLVALHLLGKTILRILSWTRVADVLCVIDSSHRHSNGQSHFLFLSMYVESQDTEVPISCPRMNTFGCFNVCRCIIVTNETKVVFACRCRFTCHFPSAWMVLKAALRVLVLTKNKVHVLANGSLYPTCPRGLLPLSAGLAF